MFDLDSILISPGIKIDILIPFCLELFPIILIFMGLKMRMKVGEINSYAFGLFYLIINTIIYNAILPVFYPLEPQLSIYVNNAGILIGIPFGVFVFNIYKPEVTLNIFFEVNTRTRQTKLYFTYLYEHKKETYIVEYDIFRKEPFTHFLKRIFGIKKKVYFESPIKLTFFESGINTLYIVKSIKEVKVELKNFIYDLKTGAEKETPKTILRKQRYQTYLLVDPVASTTFNEVEYITNFENYMNLNKKIAKLYKEKMEAVYMSDAKAMEEASSMIDFIMSEFKKPIEAYKKIRDEASKLKKVKGTSVNPLEYTEEDEENE